MKKLPLILMLAFLFTKGIIAFAQFNRNSIVGRWTMMKYIVKGDTKNSMLPKIYYKYTFEQNGVYTRTLIREDEGKGVFITDGIWNLSSDRKFLILSDKKKGQEIKSQKLFPGYNYLYIVSVDNSQLVLEEKSLNGEEGVLGNSYYTRESK